MGRVSEVMTARPVGLPATAVLTEAAKVMEEHDIGDVLALSDTGVEGIVTDRDIVIRGLAQGLDPSVTALRDIASEVLVTVQASDSTKEAARLIREKSVRRLPVYDGDEAVGMVSIGDLAVNRDPKSALADVSGAEANK